MYITFLRNIKVKSCYIVKYDHYINVGCHYVNKYMMTLRSTSLSKNLEN